MFLHDYLFTTSKFFCSQDSWKRNIILEPCAGVGLPPSPFLVEWCSRSFTGRVVAFYVIVTKPHQTYIYSIRSFFRGFLWVKLSISTRPPRTTRKKSRRREREKESRFCKQYIISGYYVAVPVSQFAEISHGNMNNLNLEISKKGSFKEVFFTKLKIIVFFLLEIFIKSVKCQRWTYAIAR